MSGEKEIRIEVPNLLIWLVLFGLLVLAFAAGLLWPRDYEATTPTCVEGLELPAVMVYKPLDIVAEYRGDSIGPTIVLSSRRVGTITATCDQVEIVD